MRHGASAVERVIPVHPILRTHLEAWKAKAWVEHVGREPKPTDLILPSPGGKRRGVSHSNKLFQDDVRRLGLEKQDNAGQGVTRTHHERGARSGRWLWVAGQWSAT